MSNVSISNGVASWHSSVAGDIEARLIETEPAEVISQHQFHLHTDKGTFLFNVQQWTFNEQTYSTSEKLIQTINSL